MNRVFRFSLTVLMFVSVCAGITVAQSSQESLGDYARAIKKSKGAPATPDQKRVYDNDNLPASSSISVVGNAPAAPASDAVSGEQAKDANAPAAAATGDEKKGEKKDPEIKAGQSASDRKEALDAWKQKLDGQSAKVNSVAHELDLLQREYRVKSSEFYANTANRAQNPTGFAKDDADYKQKIADKQKELEDAKAKLSEMQDDARKAGAPNSITDRQQ
jgi:hypothetical protein